MNQPLDLTDVLSEYGGKWVVLSTDNREVLHSGNSLEEIAGYCDEGIVMYVPEFDGAFSPQSHI
jgi:hypothetical protein